MRQRINIREHFWRGNAFPHPRAHPRQSTPRPSDKQELPTPNRSDTLHRATAILIDGRRSSRSPRYRIPTSAAVIALLGPLVGARGGS